MIGEIVLSKAPNKVLWTQPNSCCFSPIDVPSPSSALDRYCSRLMSFRHSVDDPITPHAPTAMPLTTRWPTSPRDMWKASLQVAQFLVGFHSSRTCQFYRSTLTTSNLNLHSRRLALSPCGPGGSTSSFIPSSLSFFIFSYQIISSVVLWVDPTPPSAIKQQQRGPLIPPFGLITSP